jgi:DNA polymerase III alpha subunit (gram-positive type)
MKLLTFDLETTGFPENPKAKVIELSWALWDVTSGRIVKAQSDLIDALGAEEVPDEIVEITGITTLMLRQNGIRLRDAMIPFLAVMDYADGLFARNGIKFDRVMLERDCLEEGIELPRLPLIDDYVDVAYPPKMKNCTLSHVAADHGFLNPFPHSGLGDVMTLIRVMQVGGYDMKAALDSARTPMIEVQAHVSYQGRDLAKALGFKWNPEPEKTWTKVMRQGAYDPESYAFMTTFRRID